MSTELPQDPKEREMLLRALRDYSERCEPPELTPDCPFSVETEPGVRGCGEECMDLLGRHDAPRPSEEIDVGDGLSFRRARLPRARRPRHPAAKAFDAREIYLDDKASGPPSRWRLPAILHGLIEVLQTPPPTDAEESIDRRAHIAELLSHTTNRGLDFERHLLPHLRMVVAGAVFGHLLMSREDEVDLPEFDQADGWSSLADERLGPVGPDSSVGELGQAFGALFGPIISWAQVATAEDLFDWVPPSQPLLEEVSSSPSAEPDEDGLWIFERFTKTYVEEWSSPTLRNEWLYLHGQHHSPCNPLDMRVREVPESKLAMVMADRFTTDTPSRPQLAHMLVEPAVNFLNEGRRLEAAALFEAAVRREPQSPHALNNLGFCLLPDDPRLALDYLNEAVATGKGDAELININRMLALASMGRRTSALDLATTYLQRHADGDTRPPTWLWDINSVLQDGDPQLIECRDLQSYAVAIRTTIEGQTLEESRTNGGA